jgi:hypothetical protein
MMLAPSGAVGRRSEILVAEHTRVIDRGQI